jgi:hypothetical protein
MCFNYRFTAVCLYTSDTHQILLTLKARCLVLKLCFYICIFLNTRTCRIVLKLFVKAPSIVSSDVQIFLLSIQRGIPFGCSSYVNIFCISTVLRRRTGTAHWYSAGLQAGRSEVRVPVGAGNFSLHHRVQTESGAHPVSPI